MSPHTLHNPVIDVNVASDLNAGWPVTLGVPFAKGEMQNPASLRLLAPDKSERPLAARQLVAWPDGSMRWALLTFTAQQTGEHVLERNADNTVQAPSDNSVRLAKNPDGLRLDNGLIQVQLSAQGQGAISELIAHGRVLLQDAGQFELQVDNASTLHEKSRQLKVLEFSPLRSRVRVEGAHFTLAYERRLSYRLDVELWAGWPTLRLDYHFFNLEAGADELEINRIQVAYRPDFNCDVKRHFLQRHHGIFTQPCMVMNAEPVAIRTDQSTNVPCVEDWAMMLDDQQYPFYLQPQLKNTAPWLGLIDDESSVYMQMQDFVDMRPGRLSSRANELSIEVWPEFAGSLKLPQGRSRRQTITLAFPSSNITKHPEIEQLLNAPLHEGRACVHHDWFRQCGAFEQDLVLEPGRNLRFEKFLRRVVRLDTPQEMFDLGDTVEDQYTIGDISERSYTHNYRAVGRLPLKAEVHNLHSTVGVRWAGDDRFEPVWSNNEYDVVHTLCSEIMRNTRHDLWRTLRHFARHNLEVDFVWHSDDPWQHYGSPAHSARHNMASAYPSHMWTQGLLEYYCLSGDIDALEVATALGDTILKNFKDPERRPLLWGFNREVGWPILALVHLADLTGEERFWAQLAEFVEYLISFDREGIHEPVKLSGVNPRHNMDRQIAGSFFGYASMVEGLHLYAQLKDHPALRQWLAELLLRLKAAWWQNYREGRGGDGRAVQGMAIGYELTGDDDFLRIGMLALEELTDSPGWFHSARSTKSVATTYRAYIHFLHHAERAGLLNQLEYHALQGRELKDV